MKHNQRYCSLKNNSFASQTYATCLRSGKPPNLAYTVSSVMSTTDKNDVRDQPPRITVAIATFCLCIFLASLDAVIIGNALPAIAEDLHATPGSYAWIGAAYNMAWASLLLTWGRVSDIFGRKPVLLVGALVFFIGSIVAATSSSIEALISGRTVQGLGAGAWIVTISACITDLFSLR